ncbi:MAG: shikimate kinase [Hyphomicrobiales bacterium]|nr:shikimate kinase [Hyphomicrobiales bacterium]
MQQPLDNPKPLRPSPVSPGVIAGALGGRSIALIGLMGAGKSAIGRRLAARLDLPYADADTEIEAAAGESVESIFAHHGEAAFRDGERRVIARLLDLGSIVLATGGGAYMNVETRERLRQRAITVWLRAELAVLLNRVARRDNRPLLKIGDPRAVMERLIAERYPIYAHADLTVESRDVAHEVIVDEIITGLLDRVHTATAT